MYQTLVAEIKPVLKTRPDAGPPLTLEHLLRLARHLGPPELALIQSIYERGMSPIKLARATQCCPKVLRLRLKRIRARLVSPLFRFVVNHRLDWPMERRIVGEGVILRGYSQRVASTSAGISLHRVRRELDRIHAMCELERPR